MKRCLCKTENTTLGKYTELLFCEPEEITEEFIDFVKEQNYLLLVIYYDETTDYICNMLQNQGIPFAVYCFYSEDDLEEIFNGDWFFCIQKTNAIFTFLIPTADCITETRAAVHAYIKKVRLQQIYNMIPIEIFSDRIINDISDQTRKWTLPPFSV